MKEIAIISQSLRARYCVAYASQGTPLHTIFTSDPEAFSSDQLHPSTQVVIVSPPPELLPSARLTRARWFRSVVRRARSGSSIGRWLERTVKRFAWRLRYIDRLILILRSQQTPELDAHSIETSPLYMRLTEEYELGTIDRILVFDLFDLPVALSFAKRHNLEVLVR